tara:strand:- start:38670 stop:40325 length:1656 start_codon:yes stop_codon:yes gene_type:complete
MQTLNVLKLTRLTTIKRPVISLFVLQFLCIAMLVFSNAGTSHAKDNGMEEWHYTLRPGDTLQEISLSLLNHKYTWSDVVKHNRIDQLANIAPGSIVKIPMHWLKHQPKPAKVMTLTGSVQIKKASSSRYEILKQDMLIRVGDEIATRKGNVVIEFADSSTIRLEENSNLVFNKLSHFGKTGMVDTRLRLKRGSLTTDIPPLVKGSRYEIKTPSAVAAVRGTEFRLHSTEKQTQLEVLEGTVEFSGKHGQVMVNAGKGATIKDGSPLIEIIDLPAPPKTQVAQEKINKLPVTIKWEKSRDASAYQVQLTENNKDGKLIQRNTQNDTSLEIDQIKNGDYELAVRSINSSGYKGTDTVSKLSVDIGAVKVQLLGPLDGAIVEESTPSFSWDYPLKTSTQVLSRLDIALDKEFAALITENEFSKTNEVTLKAPLIPGQYFWRIASLTNNTELSFSDSYKFNVKGWLPPIQILSVNYLDKQVGLFWSPVANAKGYILQVSDRIDFSTTLKEEKLNKPRAHLLLNPGKRYYARVKGIGNNLYSSKFGPIQEILIEPK